MAANETLENSVEKMMESYNKLIDYHKPKSSEEYAALLEIAPLIYPEDIKDYIKSYEIIDQKLPDNPKYNPEKASLIRSAAYLYVNNQLATFVKLLPFDSN